MGQLMRSKQDAIIGIKTDGRILACHGKFAIVDFYLILNKEEIRAKKEKRLRKLRKRAR